MRRVLKSSVSVAASLVVVFLLLFSQSTAYTVAASIEPSRQSPTAYAPAQEAILRVSIENPKALDSLIASGVKLLHQGSDKAAYILTTIAKFEELKQQGWSLTLLYVRHLEGNQVWESVVTPSGGECAYSITPTEKSFAAGATLSNFNLTTGPTCEWTAFTVDAWVQVNGAGQGTGSSLISFSVGTNGTSGSRIGHIFLSGPLGGLVFTIYQGVQFNDVPVGHPFYLEIGKLSARGVTVGCGSGNYCPNELVTREQIAALILRAKGEFDPPTPGSQRYLDVSPANPFYKFIDRLAELGITQGCSAMNYCPTASVRRDETAAFIIRGIGEFNPPTPATQRYGDVLPASLFYNFIDRLAALGITQGCSSSPALYCPASPITRAQIAAFLVRAFIL